MRDKATFFKWIVAVLIPSVPLGILIKKAGFANLVLLSKEANLSLIMCSLLFYFASNAMKTVRFRILLTSNRVNFDQMFYLNAVYNFLTAMLPGGTGELSYPLLLKRMFNRSIASGLTAVVITRINDIFLLSLCFVISGITVLRSFPIHSILILFVIPLVLFIVILFYSDKLTKVLSRGLQYLATRMEWKTIDKLQALLNDIDNAIGETKSSNIYLKIILHTLCIWLPAFMFFYFVFMALGTPLTFIQAIFLGTAMNLLTIIPINTVGGFGIREATLAGLLLLMGFDQETACSLGILVRLVAFLSIFVLLGFAFALNKLLHRIWHLGINHTGG